MNEQVNGADYLIFHTFRLCLIQMLLNVLCIDHSNDSVKAQLLLQNIIDKECLRDRRGVC